MVSWELEVTKTWPFATTGTVDLSHSSRASQVINFRRQNSALPRPS